ncbi:MAG: GAF domain-containing protein, partial [Verrucomicrobiales bacterium]
MKYAEAIDWLYGSQLFGIKLGLDNARRLLCEFVESEPGFATMRVVHVAGTNGKGSVCALADSTCRAAGLRTGLFTSPHLISFRERIRVSGEKIGERDAARLLEEMRELVADWDPYPTFFELALALGLRHFAEQGVEVAFLETGMGGRLDATNALEFPVVSVITPIALDHREWLGGRLAEIAAEKAGIIKPGVPAVSARQCGEVLAVLREAAKHAGSDLRMVENRWEKSAVGLPGGHQRENAALAVAALAEAGIAVSPAAIAEGLAGVRWRGRLERIPRVEGRELVVDGSGVRVLDLKSKNGTKVNGTTVMEAVLKDGDCLHLGKFEITFNDALESKVVLDDHKPLSEEAGTIIRSVGELSRLLDEAPAPKEPTDQKPVPADVEEIGKANRILKVLTKVAETLIAVRPVEEVLHQVMDIVFDHVPADRGFLMLRDEGGSSVLVPMVVKHRDPSSGGEDRITISKTIADTVMKDRVAILTSDAMVDPRFGAGDSIRFHGIRSAMCSPLWHEEQVIGIIHVDSPMLTNCFTPDDLDVLTALANYAAVAIERARLNQKIVAEEKKRERLGRFLSPQVTSRILAASDNEGSALGDPEVRDVSVLFADISGFTRLSERMSPSAVALLLNS